MIGRCSAGWWGGTRGGRTAQRRAGGRWAGKALTSSELREIIPIVTARPFVVPKILLVRGRKRVAAWVHDAGEVV